MSALKDKIEGYLEVGIDPATFEVVLNLDHDRNGVGHICFSPRQARALARLLTRKANDADKEYSLAQGGRPDAAGGIDTPESVTEKAKTARKVGDMFKNL